MREIFLLFAPVPALLGLLLLGVAAKEGWTLGWMLRARPRDAGTVSPGLVSLTGTVQPAEQSLTSPLGRECVAYLVEVDAPSVGDRSGREAHGRGAVPFYVADGTGQVLVDNTPRSADLTAGAEHVLHRIRKEGSYARGVSFASDADVESTTATEHLLDALDVNMGADPGESVTVTEHRIEPGDELYALGTAVAAPSLHDGERTVVNRRWRPFLATTGSRGRALRGQAVSLAGSLVGGVALAGGRIRRHRRTGSARLSRRRMHRERRADSRPERRHDHPRNDYSPRGP